MASEPPPPFSGTPTLFGAHHPQFASTTTEAVSGNTASYFGGGGGGMNSPTDNPFAFVSNSSLSAVAAGQTMVNSTQMPAPPGGQDMQPFYAPPPAPASTCLSTAGTIASSQDTRNPFSSNDSAPVVGPQHNALEQNAFSATAFDTESKEDPFDTIYQAPRSVSSQEQTSGDTNTNVNAYNTSGGSSSAPVTSVVTTLLPQSDSEGHVSLDSAPSLSKLISMPISSSTSSIERPPLSPVLSLPSSNATNALLPTNQYHSYNPLQYHSHPPTNATNATMEDQFSVPYANTNAAVDSNQVASQDVAPGLTMKGIPTSVPHPHPHPPLAGFQQNIDGKLEMSIAERDYLVSQAREKTHIQRTLGREGDNSLSSSLNQSVSSLLDSQEDISQSPVKLLPPAPETQSQDDTSTPLVSQQFPLQKITGRAEFPESSIGQNSQICDIEKKEQSLDSANTVTGPPQALFPASSSQQPTLHAASLTTENSSQPFAPSQPHRDHSQLVSFIALGDGHGEISQPNPDAHPPGSTTQQANVPHMLQGSVPPMQQTEGPGGNLPQTTPPQHQPIPNPPVPPTHGGGHREVSHNPPLNPPAHQPLMPRVPSSQQIVYQPPLQLPPAQIQQPAQGSAVYPPPLQQNTQTSVLPPPESYSSVLPPPSESNAFHTHPIPPTQERTNADILPPPAPKEDNLVNPQVHKLQPADSLAASQTPLPENSRERMSMTESVQPLNPLGGTQPPVSDGQTMPNALNVSAHSLPPSTEEASKTLLTQNQPASAQHRPLSTIPSYARPPEPSLVSTHGPPSNAQYQQQPRPVTNVQGIIQSGIHPPQSWTQPLMTSINPPPPPPPEAAQPSTDNARIQTSHLSQGPANTLAPSAIERVIQHPNSVPLHHTLVKSDLPSSPDSVFSPGTTSEAAPPVTTNSAMSGAPLPAASIHPLSTLPPKVRLTQTQPVAHTQPSNTYHSHSSALSSTTTNSLYQTSSVSVTTNRSQALSEAVTTVASSIPTQTVVGSGRVGMPGTSSMQLQTNRHDIPAPALAPASAFLLGSTKSTVSPGLMQSTSVSGSTQSTGFVQSTVSTLVTQSMVTSNSMPSTVLAGSAGSVQSTAPAPVAGQQPRAPATSHPGHPSERQPPPAHYHRPPPPSSQAIPSSSHQPIHHHGHPDQHPHPPPHGYGPRSGGRQWRHQPDPRQRERYEPAYYGEDPYDDYNRQYYEDPYYRDYYRPRPSSRAPHMYYPEHYDPEPSYYTEYDPYTGKYYYVEDPYAYNQGDYDPYHSGYYEQHPRDPGIPGQRGSVGDTSHPVDARQRSHPQGYPEPPGARPVYPPGHHEPLPPGTGTVYPDQSTIDGPGGMFEEGGTFFESPDARRNQPPLPRVPPYIAEESNAQHTHPEYGHLPASNLPPEWGNSEPPATVEPPEPPIELRRTPEKFACPHVRASFAPGGTLVVVLPHNLRAFQKAEVELSHVTELVNDSVQDNLLKAVAEFPGPLMPGDTPKSVAVSYATKQAEQCRAKKQAMAEEEEKEEDADAMKKISDEALLWDFLVLLCQQNGVLVASDISELLTREKVPVIPTRSHTGSGDQEDGLENIRQLLICGRKREALELACSQCLWGHALMLAGRMDEQSRTYVINRFTASLVTTDPLSTFYTLMLGRTPSAVKPEGLRRAGSWRPHLAMILANRANKQDNGSIVTLGDSLQDSGRLCAAHFCYHLADLPFGAYGSSNSKYMLLGTKNEDLGMGIYPRPEQLRKMEVFEYAMSLGKLDYVLPHFQVFKFLLALQLTQFGMVAKAFKYCEQIAGIISKSPGKFPTALLHVLDELSTQLHHLNHPHGVVETELPSWLLQLQQITTDVLAGNYTSSARSTPSPTFSSVSQAYDQGRQNLLMGQTRNQFLKVPTGNYKAGSVGSSTATSSKEGSVVGGGGGSGSGGGLAPMSALQQEAYQPSNLLVSQQLGGETGREQLHQEHGQTSTDIPYSVPDHQPPLPMTQETPPVTSSSGVEGTSVGAPYYPTQNHPPYSDSTYNTNAGSNVRASATEQTDDGGGVAFGVSQTVPSAEQQNSNVTGNYWQYGTSTITAVTSGQPQEYPSELYGQPPPNTQWQPYPAGNEGHNQQQGGGGGGVQEPAPSSGYGQQQDPNTTNQGGIFQPNPPPASNSGEPSYGGLNYWGTQYPSVEGTTTTTTASGPDSSGDTIYSSHIQPSNETNREEEEVKRNEEEEEEEEKKSSKGENATGEQGKSGGILSFFMPWRRTGPPRAKLPSDREPKVRALHTVALQTLLQNCMMLYCMYILYCAIV